MKKIMENQSKTSQPKSDEEVCFNCKFLNWMVALGQGVKCKLDNSNIPSRFHTCSQFEFKTKTDE